MNKFFISGLQRTGTNYTQALLNHNVDCNISWEDVYWKHEIVVPESIYFTNKGVKGVIVVTKNPYQWIESICFRNRVDVYERYGVDYRMNDKSTMYFENNGVCFNLKSLVSLYTTFYTNWVVNSRYEKFILKYEDLLRNPHGIIDDFVKKYELKLYNNEININVANVPFSDNWDYSLIDSYKKFHLRHLERHHVDYINNHIDDSFLNKLGYNKL